MNQCKDADSSQGHTIVCVSLRGGGTERVIARIANHLDRQGPVQIITLAAEPVFYTLSPSIRVLKPRAAWRRLPKPLKALRLLAYLGSHLNRDAGARLLVFGEEVTGWVALLARAKGLRNIWLFNRGTPARSMRGLSGRLNRLIYPRVGQVVVQTRQAMDYLIARAPAAHIAVWANPIEIPELVPCQRDRGKVIAMVGSIGRNKNQKALVEAFLATSAPADGWRLWLIGDGPQRDWLETQVRRLGLVSHVEFLGQRTDVDQLLIQASIFAFTSRSEGFPNALAEAQAAGCACIAYDCPTGPSELITDGISGKLVPLDARDEFARALDELVMDVALRERLATGARDDIRRRDHRRALEAFDEMISHH